MIKSTVDLTSNRDFGFNGMHFDFKNIHTDFKKRRNLFRKLFDILQDSQDINFKNFWLVERIQGARDYYYNLSNNCVRCSTNLKKEMPWFRDIELCKQCSGELSEQYPHFQWWQRYQKNAGWIKINLDNDKIPFASWF